MFEEIVNHDGPMLTDDGHIAPRDVPGIGVEIDQDAMQRGVAEDVPSFE
jgi:L-alanine-DL-glutamate epimerase-like enolase superfamily enzyme